MYKKSAKTIDHLLLHCKVAILGRINIPSFRVRVGHTVTGGGAVGLLKRIV